MTCSHPGEVGAAIPLGGSISGVVRRPPWCGAKSTARRVDPVCGSRIALEPHLEKRLEAYRVLAIYVDADGCPVKNEVYRVARRYALQVTLVANSWMRIPEDERITLVVVGDHLDAADDWIVEHVAQGDIVITGDIPLAWRCLEKGAAVLGLKGRPFTEDNIGGVLATRDLLAQLREEGERTRGPAPFEKQDRARFLQALDQMIHAVRRRH
jgi:uncharacterized protein